MKYLFYFTKSEGKYVIVDADNELEALDKAELAASDIKYDQAEIFYEVEYCCHADNFREGEYPTADKPRATISRVKSIAFLLYF